MFGDGLCGLVEETGARGEMGTLVVGSGGGNVWEKDSFVKQGNGFIVMSNVGKKMLEALVDEFRTNTGVMLMGLIRSKFRDFVLKSFFF